jgi:hypothetical protein
LARSSEPLLVEETLADDGIFTTEWFCDPPDRGVWFAVVRQEWSGDLKLRRIFEVVIATEERHRRI